ncbi:hypothetical protein NQ317_006018 [Molorchus minor]|uniref:Uncharacterized protein n=1 Tax=Molorchus minor TaxID=1323400 RepID=A0ABQ9J307_9CUCU|nr:hypothetical protein NQ317_006018 [Molorchus minor]
MSQGLRILVKTKTYLFNFTLCVDVVLGQAVDLVVVEKGTLDLEREAGIYGLADVVWHLPIKGTSNLPGPFGNN